MKLTVEKTLKSPRKSSLVDIETEKKWSRALLHSQAQIIDQIHDAVISTDWEGTISSWNKGAEHLFQYSAKEALGRSLSIIFPEEEQAALEKQIKKPLQDKGELMTELRLRRKTGERFFGHCSLTLLRDSVGQPGGIAGHIVDVSDRKRIQDEQSHLLKSLTKRSEELTVLLQRLEERVKELTCLDGVINLIRICDTIEEVMRKISSYVIPAWKYPEITAVRVFFDRKEYVSKSFTATQWIQSSDIVINGKQRGVLEVYYLEERPMLDEGPFRDEERRLIDTLAQILSEAVEKKENEMALMESEQHFRSLVEQAADAIFVHNLEGKLVDVNQHACESLGYTREEMLTAYVPYFEMRFDLKKLMELWEHVIANGPLTAEGIHRRKDGTTFPVEVRFSLIRAEKTHYVLVLARDITERKKSEMELKKDRDQLEDLVQKRAAELKAMHEHVTRS